MVRRRVEIKPIEDNAKRHTTFTKRRQGLMKKAEEFCLKSDSEAAIITFSKAGNGFLFGHPKAELVLSRYDAESSSALAGEEGNSNVEGRVHGDDGVEAAAAEEDEDEDEEEDEDEDEEEARPLTEVQKRIRAAMENGRWDEAVRDSGVQELDEIYAEMKKIKRKVAAHEREIAATEKDNPEGGSSGGDSSRC